MAVHDGNNNQQQQSAQQQQAPQQGYAQHGYGQQQQRPLVKPGLGNINSILTRSGSYDRSETRSAEALRGLREASAAAVEAQGLTDDFELIRFDRDSNRVGLSSILVVKTIKVQAGHYAAVRTLILESEDIRLRPQVLELGNQRIETPTRPQDVYNDVYWSRIQEFLKKSRGAQDLIAVDAGVVVVPADFDFGDVEAVTKLMVASANRCDDIVARISGEQPFTVSLVKRDDERLTARIDFTGPVRKDVVGNPIRSDITVTLNRQSTTNYSKDDYYERETEFNSVTGFVNLEYSPPAQVQQPIGWGQQQPPTQLFAPTFVITDVAQADWIQAETLELWLLAVSNAYRTTAGMSWARSFLPQVGKKGIDPRDIGALGYMTQAGVKPDTKSDSFTDQDFIDLMNQLVRPNLTFAIDVNPVGEHSAVENYLIDAAFPGPNQAKAMARLVQAADNLTGGLFSQKVPSDVPLVIPFGHEIHLGYYIDESGEKRDIRDLDVLAMLNQTGGNINDFIDWYRTYCDSSLPPAIALQRRESMERSYLSKSLKITGRAVRLLLAPQFIEGLDAATREAGVQVDLENVTSVMGAQRFVGNTLVNNYSVSHNANLNYGSSAAAPGGVHTYGGVTSSGRMY